MPALRESNVETPCQKRWNGLTSCCYPWVPIKFTHGSSRKRFVLYQKQLSNNPTQKKNTETYKKSNLIKFDQNHRFDQS